MYKRSIDAKYFIFMYVKIPKRIYCIISLNDKSNLYTKYYISCDLHNFCSTNVFFIVFNKLYKTLVFYSVYSFYILSSFYLHFIITSKN